jgi:histidinol-phosphate aminotransferase
MSKNNFISPAKHIQKLVPYKTTTAFRTMLRNEVFRSTHHKYIAKLDYNESPYEPSSKVFNAVKKTIKTYPLNWYPDPDYLELKEEIVKLYNLQIGVNNVIITNGSCEALAVIGKTFCNRDDEVLMISPTYDYLRYSAEADGIKVKKFFLDEKFQFNFGQFKKSVTNKTKVVYLVNPNNPTGTIYSLNKLKEIADFLAEKKSILIVDEAYIEYTKLKSAVSLLNKCKNVVVTRTFSKAYGLANFRVGYLMSNCENIKWIDKLIPDFPINTISENATIAALKDQKYLNKMVRKVETCKNFLVKNLINKGYTIFDSPASFILVKVDDVNYVNDLLAKNNIVVRPKKHLPPLENFIRITIGKKEDCKKIIKLM